MQQASAQCEHPTPAPPVQLRCIWHVAADDSYDVQRRPGIGSGRLLGVRTVAGCGMLCIDEREYRMTAGSVLLLDQGLLGRYRCVANNWHFWWFDCLQDALQASVQWYQYPWTPQEEEDHRRAFRALQRPDAAEHALASSLLGAWICRWRSTAPRQRTSPHQDAIDSVIEAMHEHLDGGLDMADLCRIAGIGARHFRSCFRARTGVSPKRYYLHLRLAHAREILLQEERSLASLADLLGFSSAFHLSRAYSQHYGHPPSSARQQANGGKQPPPRS